MKNCKSQHVFFYSLGFRDAIASFCATVRLHDDLKKAMTEYVKMYEEKFGKENPHVTWVKQNIDNCLPSVNSASQKE